MIDDLVSIVMPVHNAKLHVVQTVESVLAQTYTKWELLAVDDNSDDGTEVMLLEMASREMRLKVFRMEDNMGPATARNIGIENAKGRFIAFIDSDDAWLPKKLEIQLSAMRNKGATLSFTAYTKMTGEGTVTHATVIPPGSVTYRTLLKSNVIACSTVMVDREGFGELRFPEIRKRQDLALWLKLLRDIEEGPKNRQKILEGNTEADQTSQFGAQEKRQLVLGLKESLCLYRQYGGSLSSNKIDAARYQWKVYREIEGLSIVESAYYFLFYAVLGLRKYWLR